MPRSLIAFLGLVFLAGCANVTNFTDPKGPGLYVNYAPPLAETPESLRVVTFNIKFANREKVLGILALVAGILSLVSLLAPRA